MNRVFIGYDPRQPIAFQVCAHSVWERASQPVSIHRLDLRTLPIKRRGLTEFSYSRYLVPYLSGFEGFSLFLDSDILVRGDVAELFDAVEGMGARSDAPSAWMSMGKLKFEWPSVILYNSAACAHMTPEFVEDESHRLYDYAWARGGVGHLPPEWNHLVGYDPADADARLVHFTKGVPVWPETKDCEFSAEWHDTLRRMNSTVSHDALMGGSVHVQKKVLA